MSWVKNTSIAMKYVIRRTGPYKKTMHCIGKNIPNLKKKNYLKMLMEGSGSFIYWKIRKQL